MPLAATRMNLEIIILSEVSQTKTNIICYHLYVESKMIQMNIYSKQNKFIFKKKKQTHRRGKQTYGYQRGKEGRGINQKFGINIHTLPYVK